MDKSTNHQYKIKNIIFYKGSSIYNLKNNCIIIKNILEVC